MSSSLIDSLLVSNDALRAIPAGPVEPTNLWISCAPGGALRDAILVFPRAIHACDVVAAPVARCARPGSEAVLCSLSVPASSSAELHTHIDALFPHVRASVALRLTASSARCPAPECMFSLCKRTEPPCIELVVHIPDSLPDGAAISVESLTVLGDSLLLTRESLLVSRGIQAPRSLLICASPGGFEGNRHTPAVSGDGILYVPVDMSSELLRFAADGTPLPPIDVTTCGLGASVRTAALDPFEGTLLLGSTDSFRNDGGVYEAQVLALDVETLSPRWSLSASLLPDVAMGSFFGIAVLRGRATSGCRSVIIASSYDDKALVVMRGSDGHILQRLPIDGRPDYVAAHLSSNSVYVSVVKMERRRPYSSVLRCSWDSHAAQLSLDRPVPRAGRFPDFRPLVVIGDFLIVGACGSPRLSVLALPSHALVHEHALEAGLKVVGLAADPSGGALVVCSSRTGARTEEDAVHVLAWPLPGMQT